MTISEERAANFAGFADKLAAFSERMTVKGVTSVAEQAQQGADLARRTSAAYAAGDKALASELRAEYVAHISAHVGLAGVV